MKNIFAVMMLVSSASLHSTLVSADSLRLHAERQSECLPEGTVIYTVFDEQRMSEEMKEELKLEAGDERYEQYASCARRRGWTPDPYIYKRVG